MRSGDHPTNPDPGEDVEIEPYLWDPSAPEEPEIAALEGKLRVLAYREKEAPMPKLAERGEATRAASDRRAARRIHPAWYATGAGLALAATAMIGWFAGRSSPPQVAPGTANPVVANTSPLALGPPGSTSAAVDRPLASPCVASDPGGGALRYEVVWGEVACEGALAPDDGYLPLETWFETDGSSRVVLEVADLGRVELGPKTRLRILPAKAPDPARPGEKNEHRLELDFGSINARIDAPPRLFIVETRAASAIDLGCAYTLEVGEDGSGVLRVGKGEVALETSSSATGRASVVHRGEVCETRVGAGAGTPFSVTSSTKFRRALSAWDFEGGSLDAILDSATKDDVVGLIRSIERASTAPEREKIVAKLDALGSGPVTAERDGVVGGERVKLEAYRSRIAKGAATSPSAPASPGTPAAPTSAPTTWEPAPRRDVWEPRK